MGTKQQKTRQQTRKWLAWLAVLFLALTISFSSEATAVSVAAAKAQPALLALAADQPDMAVRVMIHKSGPDADVVNLVTQAGGTLLHDLYMVNMIVAEMGAETAVDLSRDASVNWVSLDGRLVNSDATVHTVRDDFNNRLYSNNDGTANWASDWIETGDDGTPTSQHFQVRSDGILEMAEDNNSLHRAVDLSGALTAVLSLDYRRYSMTSENAISLEISTDSGASWVELARYQGPDNDNTFQSASYDITPYISANTVVRFLSNNDIGYNDYLLVDYIQIEYTTGASDTGTPDTSTTDTDSHIVRDDFNNRLYSNNDGTANWASDWIETGDDGTPTSRHFQVRSDGILEMAEDNNSLHRAVDLSGALTAMLSLDYRRYSMTSENAISLEISADGGASWVELARYQGPDNDNTFQSASFDITPYISANTVVRFISNDDIGYNDYLLVDYIQIEYTTGSSNHYLNTLNVEPVWELGYQGQGVTVAVIDSGVSASPDFGNRLLTQVSFNAAAQSANDNYGHGTHIAGIIGGNAANSNGFNQGIAPGVNLIGLKVADDAGMAYESDTVAALQWVFENKDQYNIRVVNMSLNSTLEQSYNDSPLDAAAEILWLNNIVVVVSAGNKGPGGGANTANAAPANDPMIITVGATDEKGTADLGNDITTPFSAFGTTLDGYIKPDVMAPGKDIVSVLSDFSSWDISHPDRVVANEYFRMSGTSMATPMVSGAVALLLQAEPHLTPDQVKYRLLHAGSTIAGSSSDPNSYPYLDVYALLTTPTTESANQNVVPHRLLAEMAMIAYWSSQNDAENIDWENVDWTSVNWNSVNWNSVNWNSVNWNSVNWNSVNWNSVNWNSVNWNSVNWNSAYWNSVSWDD